MITHVFIIINKDSQKDRIAKEPLFSVNPFFVFIDERTEKSKAKKFKSAFGTSMTPFAAIYEHDKAIKAFYGEAEEDVIEALIKYLKSC